MTIVIYFDKTGEMAFPFDTPEYFMSYKAFAALCQENGVNLYIVRGKDTYLGNMLFSSGYIFSQGTLQEYTRPITANIIYIKGTELVLGPTDKALNNKSLSAICHDKYKTYEKFGQLMAPTYLITKDNYKSILEKITTEKVVLKPVSGSEGKNIQVLDKRDVTKQSFLDNIMYLAQVFIDSSAGIAGLVTGLHDIRLVVCNGTITLCNIRQPKVGSFLANVAQGGSLTYVPLDKIPTAMLAIAKIIDREFNAYTPRLYTIDCMFAHNQPYLVELNDQPGMPFLDTNIFDNAATRFHKNLLEILTKDHPILE